MKVFSLATILLCCVCMQGCFFSFGSGGGHRYNPYTQSRLPSDAANDEASQAMKELGGYATNIQDEVSYRKNWKEELYPVVFGDKKAPNAIVVFLDYAAPQSQQVWMDIMQVATKLDPSKVQIVVFGNSREQYGTELMGCGIWIAQNRPKHAMAYYAYTLNQWNDVKHRQVGFLGHSRPFNYEFDGTASNTERPFVYNFLEFLKPPVPEKQQVGILKYAYDAGNINMFQAVQMAQHYGIRTLPAVVVNNTVLSTISVNTIMSALQ